jgi:hypothetical protein
MDVQTVLVMSRTGSGDNKFIGGLPALPAARA